MKYNKGFTTSISLVVALGGFLLGFDSAVISGAIPFMTGYFGLTELQTGWTVSSFIVGVIIGNGLSGPISDHLGRKKVLIYTSVFFAVSAVTSALAQEFWFLIIARMIGGIGVGGALLIAPVYIAEISPPAIRGKMVSFNQLNIVLGISAAYFSNYFLLNTGENNWRW
ncbi:MAG: MFS transporter, partial [Bacteroidota bacterium]